MRWDWRFAITSAGGGCGKLTRHDHSHTIGFSNNHITPNLTRVKWRDWQCWWRWWRKCHLACIWNPTTPSLWHWVLLDRCVWTTNVPSEPELLSCGQQRTNDVFSSGWKWRFLPSFIVLSHSDYRSPQPLHDLSIDPLCWVRLWVITWCEFEFTTTHLPQVFS